MRSTDTRVGASAAPESKLMPNMRLKLAGPASRGTVGLCARLRRARWRGALRRPPQARSLSAIR